jgi:hypothetical protein
VEVALLGIGPDQRQTETRFLVTRQGNEVTITTDSMDSTDTTNTTNTTNTSRSNRGRTRRQSRGI